jgi:hypothetical protein
VGCEIPPRHTRGRLRRPRVQTETKFYCHNRALMPRPALQCYDFVCAMPPGAQSIDQASSRSDRDDSNVFGGVDHAPIRLAQRVWGRLGQKIGFRISPNTSPESISIHWLLLLSFLHHARRQELPRPRTSHTDGAIRKPSRWRQCSAGIGLWRTKIAAQRGKSF